MPGIYAVTSVPWESRTRATLRSAEFGFLGVTVITLVQTPRFWGQEWSAGDLVLEPTCCLPKRTNWLIVGIRSKLLQPTIWDHHFIESRKKDQGGFGRNFRALIKVMGIFNIFLDRMNP
jgi:hypothetical protein